MPANSCNFFNFNFKNEYLVLGGGGRGCALLGAAPLATDLQPLPVDIRDALQLQWLL